MHAYFFAFQFFAQLLVQYPDKKLLQEILENDMLEDWVLPLTNDNEKEGFKILQNYFKEIEGTDLEQAEKALKEDFFNLFEMSPPKVYMHESVYLSRDKLLNEEQTIAVRLCYAEYGLQGTGKQDGPEDHLGLELNFMAHLLSLLIEQNEQQAGTCTKLINDTNDFLDTHLMKWAPKCLDEIAENASSSFYVGIARLAQGTLASFYKEMRETH